MKFCLRSTLLLFLSTTPSRPGRGCRAAGCNAVRVGDLLPVAQIGDILALVLIVAAAPTHGQSDFEQVGIIRRFYALLPLVIGILIAEFTLLDRRLKSDRAVFLIA